MDKKVVNELQQKIKRLEKQERLISKQLKDGYKTSWGSDYLAKRHDLLHTRDFVLAELRTLKYELETETGNERSVTFIVEVRGIRKKFQIVPGNAVAPSKGLISKDSPLGKMLSSTNIGEAFTINTPVGDKTYLLAGKA